MASVPAAARQLSRSLGISEFGGPASETFGAVGDDEGLLVLVAPGRTWFPTSEHRARPATVRIEVSGVQPGRLQLTQDCVVDARPARGDRR
ncbi:MAG: hypothetical protein ACRYF3_09310 [Janthinobacterium lividum]